MRGVPDAKPVADPYRAHDNAKHDDAYYDIAYYDIAYPNADHDNAKYKPRHRPAVEFVPIRPDQPDDDTNDHTVNEQHRSG